MYSFSKFPRLLCQVRSFSSRSKLIDVITDNESGITTVALKRSPVNSLNTELLFELGLVLEDLEKTKSKGLILTSTLPNIFSGGLDLMEFYKCDVEKLNTFWTNLQNTWLRLYSVPYSTVALINGHSPAGGCLLAMSCDYRVMIGSNYTIGLNEAKIGLPVPFWFMDVMKSIIGTRRTELAVLSGRMYKTEEAFSIGLIDEIAENQSDGESKVNLFLKNVNTCPGDGRAISKKECRKEIIEKFLQRKAQDCQAVIGMIKSSKTQKMLELYFDAMKKKE